MDIKTYIDQFLVLSDEALSQKLYSLILNRFRVTISKDDYTAVKTYQDNISVLIEDLRENDTNFIEKVLEYLDQVNPYVADIIILLWVVPSSELISKRIYQRTYAKLIQKYNSKLTDLVTHNVIKNFCVETLSKTNYVPVHCIDLLWFYMSNMSLELSLYNFESGAYIGFTMQDSNSIIFGLSLEYIQKMGLGNIKYKDDPFKKETFLDFIFTKMSK